MKLLKISFFLVVFSLFFSCSKSEDTTTSTSTSTSTSTADVEIQDFVWSGLNAYYLWQEDVADLSDTRFANQNDLNNYLAGYPNPSNLFDNLLYQPGTVDRFSWIVDDYVALENSFQGTSLNNGMEFGLVRYKTTPSNVFGYVRYVLPNSSAANNGVTRGAIFNTINGTQITDSNYNTLLQNDSYTIGLANYNNGDPISNENTIALTKTEITENPVATTSVIEEGTKKIGYLMYNQFASNFDSELNAAFAELKSQQITDLVVDLRYNGGGSVRTATYLASMITGQFTTQVFSKQTWNQKVHDAFPNDDFNNYFVNAFADGGENINSLNLTKVYFIVSSSTASASELVINGLKPYIDVYVVGTTTVGKTVGSITLYDSDDFSKNGPNFNTSHTWAMQPIVLKIVNKNDTSDPNGITPNITLEEDFGNLGALGTRTDPLLNRTITYITTGARPTQQGNTLHLEQIGNSKMNLPSYNSMYVNFK